MDAPSSLPHEARLLLLATLVPPSPERDAALRAALARCAWDRLTTLAIAERCVGALARALRPVGDAVPEAQAARLARLTRASDFAMLYLQDRLGETVRVLAGRGIDVMLLKGAALAERYHGSFVARPMADIDLLVHPAQLRDAREALLGAGWKWNHDPALDGFYAGNHHLPPLDDARPTGLYVELHGALLPHEQPFALDDDVLWAASEPATGVAAGARIPSAVHLLWHACVHFSWMHMVHYGTWRALADVAALVRAGVDWPELVALARRSRASTACWWTLHLAGRLAGVPVPDAVLAGLRPPLTAGTLRRLDRHFAATTFPFGPACPSVRLEQRLWEVAMAPGWSGHGASRPWARTHEYTPSPAPGTAREEASRGHGKVLWHLRNLPRWTRYAGALLANAR